MYLAKELTEHSLPAIGRAFGGLDHTTVLYACRRVAVHIAASPTAYATSRRSRAASRAALTAVAHAIHSLAHTPPSPSPASIAPLSTCPQPLRLQQQKSQ